MTGINRYPDLFAASYRAAHEDAAVGDEAFYATLARRADGRVLEGACGTGRIYLRLLREGVDADGFDASRAMLDELRSRAAAADLTPSVWQADLRTVGASGEYDLVVVPYNSFPALTSVDAQLDALDALHEALRPGGRLVFDAYVPRYDVIADAFGEWRSEGTFERDGRTLSVRTRTTLASQVDQTYRSEREILDPDGTVAARTEFLSAHLPPQQVELLARTSPFERWRVRGGFDDRPLEEDDAVQRWSLWK